MLLIGTSRTNPGRSSDVRYSGQTGSRWQRVKTALLTPNGHSLIYINHEERRSMSYWRLSQC